MAGGINLRTVPDLLTPQPRLDVTTDGKQPGEPREIRHFDAAGKFVCPACGTVDDLKTRDTDRVPNIIRRRYRVCLKCGYSVRTKEVVDE